MELLKNSHKQIFLGTFDLIFTGENIHIICRTQKRVVIKIYVKRTEALQQQNFVLPSAVVNPILRMGKTICCVRLPLVPKRCLKCLEIDQIANQCKNNVNRSAGVCIAHPKYIFCRCRTVCSAHITSGSKCPVFKKALNLL